MNLEDIVVRTGANSPAELRRITELDIMTARRYREMTAEQVLYPLVDDVDVVFVAGAVFGDEGKGKTIDGIVAHPDIKLLISANSGQNAGHTIYYVDSAGVRHKVILHGVPSGVGHDIDSVIGPECTLDIVTLADKELAELDAAGIDYSRLYMDNICLVMPYHKIMDFIGKPPNSSTLQGIWPVHASKAAKTVLRLDDLDLPDDELRRKIEKDMALYEGLMKIKGKDGGEITDSELMELFDEHNSISGNKIPDHVYNFVKAEDKVQFIMDTYRSYAKKMPQRGDAQHMMNKVLESGGKVAVEMKQSVYLSNANKIHFGSATSADTTGAGGAASIGLNIGNYRVLIINVAKVPGSRVGRGENVSGLVPQTWFSDQKIETLDQIAGVCEDVRDIEHAYFTSIRFNGTLKEDAVYHDPSGEKFLVGEALNIAWSRKFGECGATTKKPRILGLFDCVQHAYVNQRQGPYLSINALDRLDNCDQVGLVVGYVFHSPEGKTARCNGFEYRNGDVILPGMVMPTERVLRYCRPIIKVMDGWDGAPIAAGMRPEGAGLPRQVQEFIGQIEYHTGAIVMSIGVGPNTEDIIYLKRDWGRIENMGTDIVTGAKGLAERVAGLAGRLGRYVRNRLKEAA